MGPLNAQSQPPASGLVRDAHGVALGGRYRARSRGPAASRRLLGPEPRHGRARSIASTICPAETTRSRWSGLVQQGKVRYIGSSSFSAGQIVEAQWTARDRNLQRFRTEQPPYSLLVRGIELDVLPTAQRHGMGILTYSPLAGGWLSGRWTADSSPTSPARQRLADRFDMSLRENQHKLEAVEQLAKVADDAGVSMIELAIAFVVNHPGVTSAIIGPRTIEQLDSQLPAADVVLDPTTLDRIDEIVRPGVNLNPADTSYGEQVLQPGLRRR